MQNVTINPLRFLGRSAILLPMVWLLAGCGVSKSDRDAAEYAAMQYWECVMSNRYEATWEMLSSESKLRLDPLQYMDYVRIKDEGPNADSIGSLHIESSQIDGDSAVIEFHVLKVSLAGLDEVRIPTELVKEEGGPWRIRLSEEELSRIKSHEPTVTIRIRDEL